MYYIYFIASIALLMFFNWMLIGFSNDTERLIDNTIAGMAGMALLLSWKNYHKHKGQS